MDFQYENITTKGCEGWINLFFGEHAIAMINNAWLADRIREKIDSQQAIEADVDLRCGCHMDPGTYCNQYEKGRCKYRTA